MAEPAGVPLLSDPYQDPLAPAGSDAADSAREPSPTSDNEDAAPASKMRRRWRLASRSAANTTLLPMGGLTRIIGSYQLLADGGSASCSPL